MGNEIREYVHYTSGDCENWDNCKGQDCCHGLFKCKCIICLNEINGKTTQLEETQ